MSCSFGAAVLALAQSFRNLSDRLASPLAEVDLPGSHMCSRPESAQASPAHCAGIQLGPHEPAHAPPAMGFSAGSLLGCRYSTGGSSDRGWAAGIGATPGQVRSLRDKDCLAA